MSNLMMQLFFLSFDMALPLVFKLLIFMLIIDLLLYIGVPTEVL